MPTLPAQADLATLLATAQRISADADQILAQGFGKVTASQKADGTLVTQTDQAVDEFITTQLALAFPDHAVLSEERNTMYDPASAFTWVIDPLDGTTNFARGMPIWGVSIALLYLGIPVLGLLSFVSLREKYHAIVNQGATFNGRRLTTAPDLAADDHHFIMLCTRTPRRYQIDTPLKPRILGSAAYHVTCVANGSALAGIETTPKLWDIAAAILILTEAGGCYRCLDEGTQLFPLAPLVQNYARTPYSMMAAANQSIMAELIPKVVSRTQ